MDIGNVITTVCKKGLQSDLVKVLEWWYEKSDMSVRTSVSEQMEKLAYRLTPSEAENIVRNMRPRGQNWSMQQVSDYLAGVDPSADSLYYYIAMNMAYNDYASTAKVFGLQNSVEFYYNIAKDFINDVDAKPYKLEKFFSE